MANIVEAEHPYSYHDDDGSEVSFKVGDRFILLAKSSEDWWKVQRTGVFNGKSVCYVPASYMKEINVNPRGERNYGNQYVNLDVYRKIINKDFDGLAKLGNQTMVVSKQISVNDAINKEYEEEEQSISIEDDEDDDAFANSLDDIPEDIRSLNLNDSSDLSPATPTSPLSFEISPRPARMKSFTLPKGWKKCNDDNGRSFYFNEEKKESMWKPPRASLKESKSPGTEKSSELASTFTYLDSSSDVSVPNGWLVEIEKNTNEAIFVNSITKERWKSCTDKNGRAYFYNLNGPGTVWELPEVDNTGKKSARRKSFDESLESMIRRRTISNNSPSHRNSKCQSVVLRSSSSLSSEEGSRHSPVVSPRMKDKHNGNHKRSDSNQSFEIIEMTPELDSLNVNRPEKEGLLYQRKVMEGGRHVKKAVWQQVYCCKYGSSLVFYKDQKMACAKPGYPTGKPESSLNLLGSVLDHVSKDKAKGKKNVFQISSYGGQTVQQFVAESQVDMGEWLTLVLTTIKRLEEEEPLPPPPPMIDVTDNGYLDNKAPPKVSYSPPTDLPLLSPISAGGRPTTPTLPKKLQQSDKEKASFRGFKRTFSKKVLTSNNNEEEKEKKKIKDKLKKYLVRRPTYSDLEKNGIIKDYVFGESITKLCEHEDTLVPQFVIQIISEVERRGLETDGLYRVSGNLSSIQKLRVMVDHGEHVDFKQPEWNDIHILTGSLKLYFRELPEPLFPFALFDRFINAMKSPFKAEKLKLIKALINEMPRENRETLEVLIYHLDKVIRNSDKNRMHAQNLAIVFGPTLMWPEHESLNMTMATVYQNQVVEFILTECRQLFTGHV
ncbi:rho GTPase-activating protein 15-like isoform X2 [Hydractinia symbiolongicarpus]|uniref:rho GTPase-activating protein 15-like isoform X2 n=1 Tax=Hydractinia symbiolongicarpus TaxID=13093 RepID=UPI00254E1EA0|nr:rho GTPase-activating protein 15-like isoform X2 [Hydractinia symbiolongicarpus]